MIKIHFLKNKKKLFTIILFLLFFPNKSYAYLDPGSGSIIIQILLMITVFLSALYSKIKIFFQNLINKFNKKKKILNDLL